MIDPKELRSGELDEIRARDAHLHPKKLFQQENIDRRALLSHTAAMALEEDHLHRLVSRQGKLLSGVVNAIRGEPGPLSLHSHHDAPDLARRVMELLRKIVEAVNPRDEQAAIDAAEAFLPPVKPLTDVGVPLPGWEEVSRKAERGEALNPIEALVMRLTPGDDERAKDFRRMLRAALDYTAQQPRVDER